MPGRTAPASGRRALRHDLTPWRLAPADAGDSGRWSRWSSVREPAIRSGSSGSRTDETWTPARRSIESERPAKSSNDLPAHEESQARAVRLGREIRLK